ncbi:MAG: TonB-dependent receptor [Cytophagales bacterium]|nr:MAG: TonB-dependent receptor [Cytophagales bacterium]
MKKLLCNFIFCFLFFFFCANINAQNFSIKAIITDNNDEKIPFATTSLWRVTDSTLIKYNISKEDGSIFFDNLPNNTYQIKIQMQGFDEFETENILVDKDIDLGKITLKSAETNLETVEINAKKPLIEILADKMVFNTENLIAATGSTVFELLQKSPGVVIDNNDNISLQGKQISQIYIDGRPSPLTGKDLSDYLKTLQGTDIEAIELITQPSSKYDAAGSGGIINIRFKKDKNMGTNASFAIGMNYGFYARYNASFTLNHRTKKASYFINYTPRVAQDYGFINLNRFQNNTQFNQQSNTINNSNSHNLRMGADFFLHKYHTLSVGINGNNNNTTGNTTSETPITNLDNGQLISILGANNKNEAQRFNGNFNTNYRFADTSGRSLNIDINIGNFNNNRNMYQPNTYFLANNQVLNQVNYYMRTPTNIFLWNIKTDYEQKLKKGTIGIGLKTSFVNTTNDFSFFNVINDNNILDENRSNLFTYTENINAAYINYQVQYKKIDIQAGLRAEQTNSSAVLLANQNINNKEVKRSYLDFFPSIGLSYAMNKKNSFALKYSQRIERPNYQDLNPFESKLDELTYQKGNPFLNPQYTKSLEASHTYDYSLNTTLSFSQINGFFAQVTDTTESNRNFMTSKNFGALQVWNMGVSYPAEINKWWNMFISINASHSKYFADFGNNRIINRQINSFSLYGQQTFSLGKNFTLELSGFFSSPSIWAGVYQTKSLGNLDIALQKKFWKNNANLKITLADAFYTLPWRAVNEFAGLYINGRGGSDSRQIRINFTYKLGNKQLKGIKQRKTGAEEETERIGN